MAGSHRRSPRTDSTSIESQVSTADSSSVVHGPFHTSTASASSWPNFHRQATNAQYGWAGTTMPPERWISLAASE